MDSAVINFGEDDGPSRRFSHPYAVIFHLLFRISALVAYLLCTWFTSSFIVSFLCVLFFLTLDFWTVKNVTGRLLAGLRWWNFVDDEGTSHWRFESRKVCLIVLQEQFSKSGPHALIDDYDEIKSDEKFNIDDSKQASFESRIFWLGLVLCPIGWAILFIIDFFTLKWQWLMIVILGLAMNGANLYGYLRCKWTSRTEVSNYLTSNILSQLLRRATATATQQVAPTQQSQTNNL